MAKGDPSRLILRNVRLSFPKLFKPEASVKDGPEKFGATALIDPNDPEFGKANMAAAKAAKKAVMEAEWPGRDVKFKDKRCCISKGEDNISEATGEIYAGYEGMWAVTGKNNQRPTLVYRDKRPIEEKDIQKVLYGGCRSDMIFDLYTIKDPDKGGNGLFATLELVRFRADDESFGSGGASPDELEDLDDDIDDEGGFEPDTDDDII